MSNPPPSHLPPPRPPDENAPALHYAAPEKAVKNSVGWFMLRALIGLLGGAASIAAGLFLAGFTNVGPLFFVPPGAALTVAIWLCARQKRFGYLTGVILAPFIIGAGLVVLLLMICGGSTLFK